MFVYFFTCNLDTEKSLSSALNSIKKKMLNKSTGCASAVVPKIR